MPHFILEHSTNIEPKDLAVDELFNKLHCAAVDTGLFELAGIRSRAHPCEHFRVADGSPNYAFVHLATKVGRGRTQDELAQAAQQFFKVLSEHYDQQSSSRGLALSFEMTELPDQLKFNKNTVRNFMS